MGWMDLTASLVRSLAWPVVALVIALRFHQPLRQWLAGVVPKSLSWRGWKLELDKADDFRIEVGNQPELSAAAEEKAEVALGADVVRERSPESTLALVEVSPIGAFVTEYIELEQFLRAFLINSGVEGIDGMPMHRLLEAAGRSGLITPAEHKAFDYLREIRNRVTHSPAQLTVGEATSLVELSKALRTAVLRRAFEELEAEFSEGPPESD